MGNKIVYTRVMPARFQIVESMMWEPPPGVDPATVRFHIDGWEGAGRIDFDDLMQRRTDVIAEWYEPDESSPAEPGVAGSEDPLRAERFPDPPRPVWLPIERDRGGEAEEPAPVLDVQLLDVDVASRSDRRPSQRIQRHSHRNGLCLHTHDLTASMPKAFHANGLPRATRG